MRIKNYHVIQALLLHPEVESTKRLNVHYARMGEPTWNIDVLEHAKLLLKQVRPYIGRSHVHPVISTMLPKNNKNLIPFLQEWCEIKNYSYKKSTADENLKSGIDCYIDNIPTDIKNTKDLIFARYLLEKDQFLIRHPFRKDTVAKNICVVDLDTNTNDFKVVYNGNLEEYIIKTHFKDENAFKEFKNVLSKYEFKSLKELKMNSITHFFTHLKMRELNNFIQKDSMIKFADVDRIKSYGAKDIFIKIIKKADSYIG